MPCPNGIPRTCMLRLKYLSGKGNNYGNLENILGDSAPAHAEDDRLSVRGGTTPH
jgi:hypothetical protein